MVPILSHLDPRTRVKEGAGFGLVDIQRVRIINLPENCGSGAKYRFSSPELNCKLTSYVSHMSLCLMMQIDFNYCTYAMQQ